MAEPEDVAYAYRTEHWLADGAAYVLTVVDGPRRAHARLLRLDPARREWAHAEASVTRRAFLAPADAIARSMPLAPATATEILDHVGRPPFGDGDLLTGVAQYLATGIAGMPIRITFPAMGRQPAGPDAFGTGSSRVPFSSPEPPRGFAPPPPSEIVREPRPPRVRVGWPGKPVASPTAAAGKAPHPSRFNASLVAAARATGPSRRFLRDLLDADAMACVHPDHFSPEAYRYFTEPGLSGSRRRQAAALHPALAPTLPHAPEVTALVDAGLPFEETLGTHVGAGLALPPGARLDAARMRRVRALPPGHPRDWLLRTLHLAALLPHDLLPSDPSGWEALERHAPQGADAAADLGLPAGPFVSALATSWRTPVGGEEAARRLKDEVRGAYDMADWCATTLVSPLVDGAPHEACLRVAGNLLFAGMDWRSVRAASRIWHDGIAAFASLLPLKANEAGWPPLVGPWSHRGVSAVPLLDARSLREEGTALAHCLAGWDYAAGCHQGRHHVLSMRAADGSRLSTLQLTVDPDGPRTIQHAGRRNRRPPPAALAAEAALLREVGVGAGTLPLNPDALVRRGLGPFSDASLVPGTESPARSLAAWRPYLAAGVPGDVDALRDLCRSILESPRTGHGDIDG